MRGQTKFIFCEGFDKQGQGVTAEKGAESDQHPLQRAVPREFDEKIGYPSFMQLRNGPTGGACHDVVAKSFDRIVRPAQRPQETRKNVECSQCRQCFNGSDAGLKKTA
ncbi:hypothetical protein [Bosea sp. AS-1]|uniref:hypothetical protein n=1 Tax=Bosea sp. AS-1 TaxID=2015316 RepID=UPI0012FE6925|nr:hypothetical protein [Bosea sp. AS-1]